MLQPLFSAKLQTIPKIKHAFFTRQGGVSQGIYSSLNCGAFRSDDPQYVQENWRRAATYLGAPSKNLLVPNLVHGDEALLIEASFEMMPVDLKPLADAFVTRQVGLAVGVTSADCVPILLASKNGEMVGAVHAGWQGALKGVVFSALRRFEENYIGSENIIAAVGPCIRQSSYEVAEDVYQQFIQKDPAFKTFFKNNKASLNKYFFDLPSLVRYQLGAAGVGEIDDLGVDTYTDEERFFSCRRAFHQGEMNFGCHLSAIMIEL